MGLPSKLLLLLCSGPLVCGQQEPVYKTDVKVVNLLATVRSKQGTFIRDLTKDDFSLPPKTDARKPSAISRGNRSCH